MASNVGSSGIGVRRRVVVIARLYEAMRRSMCDLHFDQFRAFHEDLNEVSRMIAMANPIVQEQIFSFFPESPHRIERETWIQFEDWSRTEMGLVAHPINPNPPVPVISESSSDEESEDETDSFTSDEDYKEETESDSEEISDSDSLEEDEDDSSNASLEDEEGGSSDDEVVFVGENNAAADVVPDIEEINGDPEEPMVAPPD
ncbi:hypothetical protein FRX31_011978 [Thalictrum thalictroides]|uniref:Uncharacterized protein n=1 Tax=Thalictrum thalictroides TaxID=46969 RepID=A0A7J6WM49_THATH|nr:hypothetical protein FRX31_011978 [Thalictrum thalictroides]